MTTHGSAGCAASGISFGGRYHANSTASCRQRDAHAARCPPPDRRKRASPAIYKVPCACLPEDPFPFPFFLLQVEILSRNENAFFNTHHKTHFRFRTYNTKENISEWLATVDAQALPPATAAQAVRFLPHPGLDTQCKTGADVAVYTGSCSSCGKS